MMRHVALPLVLLLLIAAGAAHAQVPPDQVLRGMTAEQREDLWRSMSPQQRRDYWHQLTPEQKQSIRNHILSQQPLLRERPMEPGGEGPSRWRLSPPGQPVVPGAGRPGGALAGPNPPGGPRQWSPEERRRLRDQIQEWNRDPRGPAMRHRMGPDR
jgi:hypothetical protein